MRTRSNNCSSINISNWINWWDPHMRYASLFFYANTSSANTPTNHVLSNTLVYIQTDQSQSLIVKTFLPPELCSLNSSSSSFRSFNLHNSRFITRTREKGKMSLVTRRTMTSRLKYIFCNIVKTTPFISHELFLKKINDENSTVMKPETTTIKSYWRLN